MKTRAPIDPDGLLIWSGAGISYDLPTDAPLAAELADRVLAYGFQGETGALIRGYYRKLGLTRVRPRLETLLDVVSRVHGADAVADLLSDLIAAPPNGVHRFLAELSRIGARQITANFDSCLEDAGAADVFHFHGSLISDPTTKQLGATLAQVERGLPSATRAELDQRLSWCSSILVVGYSGSDFFDIDPYMASLEPDSLEGRTVLWLKHGHGTLQQFTGAEAIAAVPKLHWLQQAGADIGVMQGPTRESLARLAAAWGIPAPDSPSGHRPHWSPRNVPTPEMQALASLELYSLMGLKREIERMLDQTAALDPRRRLSLLADVRWFQGRYREAADARRDAGLQSPASRRPTDLWIRGQYLRARRAALQAVKEADATIGLPHELPLEERLVRAEVLARTWQHMRRMPDAKLFATAHLRQFALDHLPDPADLTRIGTPVGIHLSVRVRDARAALGANSSPAADSIETFGEYEALGAWMNYRHGRLRSEAETGHVDAGRYRQLHRDHVTLGAPGDAARVLLLPGSELVFSWREYVAAVRTLDVTPWHRGRLRLMQMRKRIRRIADSDH